MSQSEQRKTWRAGAFLGLNGFGLSCSESLSWRISMGHPMTIHQGITSKETHAGHTRVQSRHT